MKNYNKATRMLPFLLTMLLWLSGQAFAQSRTVTGTVKDAADDSALPGVNVLVKGTTVGTISDVNGNFSINVPDGGSVLIFSFVGYQVQEVQIGAQTTINVLLQVDVEQLDEVVVTGYSVDSRRETTGSVATVKARDLAVVPSGNVEQQLQGRVAGVTVITNGQPGTTSQIRVRGFGSFGGNAPLYIVDGVPVETTDFLNPDDIELTTVLKDAAAASIYGARAANGVIIYQTKGGKKGAQKLSVSYDGMAGFTTPGTGQEMMNPQDFATWTWNAIRNTARQNGTNPTFNHPQFGTGANPVIPEYILVGPRTGVSGGVNLADERNRYNIDPNAGGIYQVTRAVGGEGTDWYDAITRTAPLTRHTLGFSGGGEGNRFYVGFGMQEQDGILIHQKFRRYSLRANSEFDVTKRIRIGQNFQGTYRQVRLLQGDNGGIGSADDENVILTAGRMPSIIPIYDEFGGYAGTRAGGFNNSRNPVADLDGQQNNRAFNANAFGNIYLEVEPIDGLRLRSSIGGRYDNFYFFGYTRQQYENSENNSAFGYNEGSGYNFGWVFTNTASYKKTVGKNVFDVLVGQEALNTGAGRNMSADGINPFSRDLDFITISTLGTRNPPNSSYFKGVNFSSYFGNLKYSFNDKYFLSLVLRRDGSSRFGANSRYGTFPAFSAGWRLSAESFMSGMTWIDDLKIRGGWGKMGNSNNVNPNNQYSLYTNDLGGGSYDISGSNTGAALGIYRSRIGNPNARWEEAVTSNIGFDGRFFNDKLDIVLDLWRKDTDDLLLAVPQTVMNGVFAAVPAQNTAKMRNQGLDLQVITRAKKGDLALEITANASLLQNEIVALAPGQTFLQTVNPSFRGIQPIRNQLGQSISAFFGYEVVGLFQNAAEVASAPTQPGAAPGRFRYRDISGPDGTPDGIINDLDRTYIGSPVPDFTGGLNLRADYKNFTLETYIYASIGNDIYNHTKWWNYFYPSFAGSAIAERVKDSWTFDNPNNDIPVFENVSNFSTNTQSNSWYVEDGSYLRMQNITLSYNVPANMLRALKLERARVSIGTNNVFTISGYEGLDPAVGGAADTNFGIDLGNFPITRSYTVGVSLGF